MTAEYGSKNIETFDNLSYVKLRPSFFIHDTSTIGQFSIAKEIIDNAIDEMCELVNEEDGEISIFLLKETNMSYSIIITDNGRGVPLNMLEKVFTKLNTSGKFNQEVYKNSTGSFGVGSKATVGLSKYFRAISFRPNGTGNLFVKSGGDLIETNIYDDTVFKKSGSIIIYKPSNTIFSNMDKFIESEYSQIVVFLELLSLFAKYRIRFYIVNKGHINLWDSDIHSISNYIEKLKEINEPVFDNTVFSKMDFIIRNFKTPQFQYDLKYGNEGNVLRFRIEVYSNVNFLIPQNANKITFVNNIPFQSDNRNVHTSMFYSRVALELSKKIVDKTIKQFVIKEYKVPINILMDVKFQGAVFTGTTKHVFADNKFKDPFNKALNEVFADNVFIEQLYEYLKDDIIEKFNISTNKQFLNVTSNKQLLIELNRPSKFTDCNTSDYSKAELFLAEGESAKSGQGRNPEYQAIYALGGKPFNSLTSADKTSQSIDKIKKNKIFQDIIRLVGIIPGSDNLSNLRYDKVFIMTDADVHGYHIANIIIGNLCVLCPKFVEEGHLYLVIPPLYGLKSKSNSQLIFLKNYEQVIAYLTECIYSNIFEISLTSPAYKDKKITGDELVGFISIVLEVGALIKVLSEKLNIQEVILEQLTCASEYLHSDSINADKIKEIFNADVVTYDNDNKILTLSIGSNDIIIPLLDFNVIIYEKLLPLMNKYFLNRMEIRITTLHSNMFNNALTSITDLYNLLLSIEKQFFEVERYKGLGKMPPKHKYATCMDKNTRRTFQIKSIGDISRIFELLGDDSGFRKQLLI